MKWHMDLGSEHPSHACAAEVLQRPTQHAMEAGRAHRRGNHSMTAVKGGMAKHGSMAKHGTYQSEGSRAYDSQCAVHVKANSLRKVRLCQAVRVDAKSAVPAHSASEFHRSWSNMGCCHNSSCRAYLCLLPKLLDALRCLCDHCRQSQSHK